MKMGEWEIEATAQGPRGLRVYSWLRVGVSQSSGVETRFVICPYSSCCGSARAAGSALLALVFWL